jgi:serine/threonine-protein kinase
MDAKRPWYFVMEYLRGGSLEGFVKKFGPLSIRETTNIAGNVGLGLFHLMEEFGANHNDVSLKNIMFREEIKRGKPFSPVLIDFGSAAGIQRFQDEAGAWYIMSPERVKIASGIEPPEMITQVDPEKTDVWSLGIMIYFMLTKELPFSSYKRGKLTSEIINKRPREISEYNSRIPEKLESFILNNILCKNYRARPSIEEVLNYLRPYGSGNVRSSRGS